MVEQIVGHQAGCRVIGVASDVETARQMITDLMPNVVTLDLAMPGLGGLGFLDELREIVHVPIVVVSSSTTPGSLASEDALARGADACFDKARIVADALGFLRVLK